MKSDSILDKAASLKAEGKPFALVTVVRTESPTSAKPGDKAIVELEGEIQGWIGGGCAQPAVLKSARESLIDGQPRLIRITPTRDAEHVEGIIDFGSSCYSGGTLDIFIEPIMTQSTLLIIGTSPVAKTLCTLASRVGFKVIVAARNIDDEQFADATHIISDSDPAEFDLPGSILVVVATQGQRDEAGLVAALETGASYIAFVASGRKAEKLRDKLKQRGLDEARVNSILAPAGIEIGAETPEEIALSILADLVKQRRTSTQTETNQSATASAETGSIITETKTAGAGCCHK